jgi:hypothetical protein
VCSWQNCVLGAPPAPSKGCLERQRARRRPTSAKREPVGQPRGQSRSIGHAAPASQAAPTSAMDRRPSARLNVSVSRAGKCCGRIGGEVAARAPSDARRPGDVSWFARRPPVRPSSWLIHLALPRRNIGITLHCSRLSFGGGRPQSSALHTSARAALPPVARTSPPLNCPRLLLLSLPAGRLLLLLSLGDRSRKWAHRRRWANEPLRWKENVSGPGPFGVESRQPAGGRGAQICGSRWSPGEAKSLLATRRRPVCARPSGRLLSVGGRPFPPAAPNAMDEQRRQPTGPLQSDTRASKYDGRVFAFVQRRPRLADDGGGGDDDGDDDSDGRHDQHDGHDEGHHQSPKSARRAKERAGRRVSPPVFKM